MMKIEYHNLYTHFILITQGRIPFIFEKSRDRIEKYITGVVNNNHSKLYSIYANPEHVHFIASRSPGIAEENWLPLSLTARQNLLMSIASPRGRSPGNSPHRLFQSQNLMSTKYAGI